MTDQKESAKESARKWKKAERDRKRANGLVPIELWIKPEHKQDIVEFVEKLKNVG